MHLHVCYDTKPCPWEEHRGEKAYLCDYAGALPRAYPHVVTSQDSLHQWILCCFDCAWSPCLHCYQRHHVTSKHIDIDHCVNTICTRDTKQCKPIASRLCCSAIPHAFWFTTPRNLPQLHNALFFRRVHTKHVVFRLMLIFAHFLRAFWTWSSCIWSCGNIEFEQICNYRAHNP